MENYLKEIEKIISNLEESFLLDESPVIKEIASRDLAYLMKLLIHALMEYGKKENLGVVDVVSCFRIAQSLKIIEYHPYWEELIQISQMDFVCEKIPDFKEKIYLKIPEYLPLIKGSLEKIKILCKI
jgi:hypothetical protein